MAKLINMMMKDFDNKGAWKYISVREKWQIVNGTVLVFSAIILYFVAFIVTLTIGLEIISAGATLLATGLAFFGISSFVKTNMIDIQTKVAEEIRKLENERQQEQQRSE